MTDLLQTVRTDGVLCLTLNRADKLNALNRALYGALAAALAGADTDPQVRAVLLSGHGPGFCAGHDLQDFLHAPPAGVDDPVFRLLETLATRGKPLIAAVQGPAVGIGATLLLHCDLVVAAPSASLQFPFVPLGLVPEAGSTLLLPQRIGHARAMELFLLGQPCDAKQALRFGLVNHLVPEAALQADAQALARAVAAQPAEAVATLLHLVRPPRAPLLDHMRTEGEAFCRLLQGPAVQQALAQFFARRAGRPAEESAP